MMTEDVTSCVHEQTHALNAALQLQLELRQVDE